MAVEVLKYLGIYDIFDLVVGAQLLGNRLSKKDVLLETFSQFGINEEIKHKVLLVGDTSFDVKGAVDVGIDCIGVSFGYGDKEDMLSNGAIAVVDEPNDILDCIR